MKPDERYTSLTFPCIPSIYISGDGIGGDGSYDYFTQWIPPWAIKEKLKKNNGCILILYHIISDHYPKGVKEARSLMKSNDYDHE